MTTTARLQKARNFLTTIGLLLILLGSPCLSQDATLTGVWIDGNDNKFRVEQLPQSNIFKVVQIGEFSEEVLGHGYWTENSEKFEFSIKGEERPALCKILPDGTINCVAPFGVSTWKKKDSW